MKVKKGDLVQMLSGKDRGKQGRVLDAQPREGRVIVENLNIVKRHTKPRPIRNANRMGGSQMTPGGIIERAAAVPVSNVMIVCPTCKLPTRIGYKTKDVKGETIKVRVCKRARLRAGARLMAITETYVPRLKQRYNEELREQLQEQLGLSSIMQVADGHEDHAQHGRRRGEDRREGARRGDGRADDHRRPARADAPRPQVGRAVQDPRGHADRRRASRCAATGCGSSSTA